MLRHALRPHAPGTISPRTRDARPRQAFELRRCRPVHRGRHDLLRPGGDDLSYHVGDSARAPRDRAPVRGPARRTSGRAPRPSGAARQRRRCLRPRDADALSRIAKRGRGRPPRAPRGTIGPGGRSLGRRGAAPIPTVGPRATRRGADRGRRRTTPADRAAGSASAQGPAPAQAVDSRRRSRPRRRPRSRASRRTPSTRRRTAADSVGNPGPRRGRPPARRARRPRRPAPRGLSSPRSLRPQNGCRRPMTITAIPGAESGHRGGVCEELQAVEHRRARGRAPTAPVHRPQSGRPERLGAHRVRRDGLDRHHRRLSEADRDRVSSWANPNGPSARIGRSSAAPRSARSSALR